MGILKQSQYSYYNNPSEFGNYQFTSLEDIINQFMVTYVGEQKIINKISRVDVAFHAQRAMQELSFDTFKSIKSQEIELPPSLTMILPHDYVNYTRMLWSDSSGIKHPIYPIRDTQNPFKIKQTDDGSYDFLLSQRTILANGDFSKGISTVTNNIGNTWKRSEAYGSNQGSNLAVNLNTGVAPPPVPENDTSQNIASGQYEWKHVARVLAGGYTTRHFSLWQTIDVSGIDYITLSAKGISSAAKTGKTAGIVRVGFSTQIDITAQDPTDPAQVNGTDPRWDGYNPDHTNPNSPTVANLGKPSKNMDPDIYDVSNLANTTKYIEFNNGDDALETLELVDVDVRNLTTVDLLVVSSGGTIDNSATIHTGSKTHADYGEVATSGINAIDDIALSFDSEYLELQSDGDSTTWTNYKSGTPSENQDSYDDDYYINALGQRYGLDPQHAQVNGSFYVDNLRGLINFSSNISGKTVILDYISDSLGTDGEMQVHKFAEEAMYKWIMYAILSTRANTPEYIVRRYQKEKFAATRQAKLRLSNIKLEELTQILRGKSKHIKH